MLALLLCALALSFAPAAALWPLPRQLTTGNATLRLSPSFSFALDLPNPPPDLADALSRTAHFLLTDDLAPLTPDRGASVDVSSSPQLETLVLSLDGSTGAENVSSIAKEVQKPLKERDEGYVLSVPSDGSNATLTANTTLGLFRGLTTFSQLWYTSNGATYANQVPLQVEDIPAYVSVFLHCCNCSWLNHKSSLTGYSCSTPLGTCTPSPSTEISILRRCAASRYPTSNARWTPCPG